ncbi:MAG: hypothetical protein AAF483_30220 [Planctomycetota bacterium]
MTEIVQHVRSHPPQCLDTVDASPISSILVDRGPDAICFRLSRNSQEACSVHGYDLAEYISDHDGPLEFISPLSLLWPDRHSTKIFDSDIHGYHGEFDSSAKLRGSGSPMPFKCTKCSGESFIVDVQLNFYDDLFEEFDPLEVSDYFHNIVIYGTCTFCSAPNAILDMDL